MRVFGETVFLTHFSLGLFLAAWLVCGYDVLWKALGGILRLQWLDENFLMATATVGALCLGEYQEAVFVMLLYQTGELFQRFSVRKTRRSIAVLSDLCPDTVHLLTDGTVSDVSPEEVQTGDMFLVRAGERVPLDGVILSGESTLDTSALTGESLPREAGPDTSVAAGCINLTGVLTLQATKVYTESTVARILELTETAADRKAPAEQFITKFARIYTPAVVLGAVLLCVIPTLLGGSFVHWFRRSLLLLMVSCPCALVISVPLSFFGGLGAAARRGILVKGANFTEVLSRVDTVIFDKTGTLTKGQFTVNRVASIGILSENRLLQLAAAAEQHSSHPLAVGLVKSCSVKGIPLPHAGEVKEEAGFGVSAVIDGHRVQVGGKRLLKKAGLPCPHADSTPSVYLLYDGDYAGCFALSDEPKEGAAKALSRLKEIGIKETVMLTGDSEEAARPVAREIGIDRVFANLLPKDKVARVETLLHRGGAVLFVGDGINDAPVLARSDVGMAMGALGSDAAIEAADVVLMDDRLDRVAEALLLSRKTVKIVRQNIVFSLTVKLAVLIAATVIPGMNMAVAIFADVGVMMLAVLNSLRTLH